MNTITIGIDRDAFKEWLKAQPHDKQFNMLSSTECAGHDYIQALFPTAQSVIWIFSAGEVRFPNGDITIHAEPQQFSEVLMKVPCLATPLDLLMALERYWPVEDEEDEIEQFMYDSPKRADVWYEPATA